MINLGYPIQQLLKALAKSDSKAAERVRDWLRVIEGTASGALDIGSRTPITGLPAWVTPHVLHGGFATDVPAAAGPFRPHERALAARQGCALDATARGRFNGHFITDPGLAELGEMLESGCYELEVPEEGALLVVAWLLRQDENTRAAALLEELQPYFAQLRFYPAPRARPTPSTRRVAPQTIAEVARNLGRKQMNPRVAAMNESLGVWAPLYARAVALFREDNFDEDWRRRASELLDDYAAARARHRLSGKPEKRKENFARLRDFMRRIIAGEELDARALGNIRWIVECYIAKHGVPGDAGHTAELAHKAAEAARPMHHHIAHAMTEALATHPQDGVLDDIAEVLTPLQATYPAIPPALVWKLRRCVASTLDALVTSGLVTSSDALAKLLPRFVAQARTSSIADDNLARLHESLYVAFHERRSLLLLNLAAQVKLEELPWVRAIAPWIVSDDASRAASHATLVEFALLALRSFPQAIPANPFVEQLTVLAQASGLQLPFVEELAADIFAGTFAPKFIRAAHVAAKSLTGSLYARYYDIDYADVSAIPDNDAGLPTFVALCRKSTSATTHRVVENARVIERAQIITSHNMATLVDAMGLDAQLDRLALAEACGAWILSRRPPRDQHARLRLKKSMAYAWRQMVFYLSALEGARVEQFAGALAAKCTDAKLQRHARDLAAAARGVTIETPFLGWS